MTFLDNLLRLTLGLWVALLSAVFLVVDVDLARSGFGATYVEQRLDARGVLGRLQRQLAGVTSTGEMPD